MKKKVLLAAHISKDFQMLLDAKGYDSIFFDDGEIPFDANGIVTSTKLTLNKKLLSQFDNLKWIARLGSGTEIIDTEYCRKNNIAFASSPAGIANAVGEHCVSMLVALQKNIASSFCEVKNRKWSRELNRGWEIFDSTIGLIGYGHTGQAFAKKLAGFNCNIIAFDKYKTDFGNSNVQEVSLKELQERADVISFHVPANTETFHYYNEKFIANCKSHILLNTSRGDVVSTVDLIKALGRKKIIGAALDVLENEQFLANHESEHWQNVDELLKFNTIITPHIAGYSYNAIQKMSAEIMEKLKGII